MSSSPPLSLRDHSKPCEHAPDDYSKVWGDGFHIGHEYQWAPVHSAWCPGGQVVTTTDITEMAYSLWQAEQMDEYYKGVL